MLSVQNYSLVTKQPSFKAEQNENKKPVQKPFTTNAGLKTGAVYGGISSALLLSGSGLMKFIDKFAKDVAKDSPEFSKVINENPNALKNAGKGMLMYLPISVAVSLGCGALVDKINNKKHAAFADRLEKEGKDKVLKSDDNADYTSRKNVYYKSDTGKKIGTALGLVVFPVLGCISALLTKQKINSLNFVLDVLGGALGGLILGAITDNITNNNARKHADIQARKAEK